MSIATKLTYLNTTKGKIKDSINNLGGSIDSNTTFRDYATQLDSIYARLPKVSGTGSNITLTPTLKGRLGSVLNGDTFQQTYTGKNLFNKYGDFTYGSGLNKTNLNLSNQIVSTSNFYDSRSKGQLIENLKENTNYCVSGTIISANGTNPNNVVIQILNTSNQNIKTQTYSSSLTKPYDFNFSFNTDTNTSIWISFNGFNNSAGGNTETIFDNIQIEEGSSPTSYEQYVGGTASPNPDYPQDIQCVEGIQNITVSGKNLFNPENNVWGKYNVWQNNAGNFTNAFTNTFNVKGGEVCSISFKNNSGTLRPSYQFIDDENNYLSGNYWSANVSERKYQNISIPPNATKVIICQLDGKQEDDIQIQFEYNSTSTTYQAYQTPQTVQIDLGNIKMYDGDKFVGYTDNWSIVRNNEKIILDGSEDWTYYQNNIFYTYIYNYPEILKSSAINCISDSYKCLISTSSASDFENLSANYDYTMNLHTTIELIRIKDTRFTTSQQLKTALTNNNVEVVYKLATPTTTPITDTTLISQLNNVYNLKSYDDTTNISVEGNLPMILEVSALKGE